MEHLCSLKALCAKLGVNGANIDGGDWLNTFLQSNGPHSFAIALNVEHFPQFWGRWLICYGSFKLRQLVGGSATTRPTGLCLQLRQFGKGVEFFVVAKFGDFS